MKTLQLATPQFKPFAPKPLRPKPWNCGLPKVKSWVGGDLVLPAKTLPCKFHTEPLSREDS